MNVTAQAGSEISEPMTIQVRQWASRFSWPALGEPQRFLLLSILIGLFAGLLVVCFHIAIEFVRWNLLGAPGQGVLRTLLSPMLGGWVATLLVLFGFRAAVGSGVNHTKAALYISDGYVPFSTVIGKFLACSLSIGSGISLGPEDPALQMGSGIASYLGRRFRLARENLRLIAPIGAAAGVAAAFNTPITGVLFVMEEVVASWHTGVLGSVVLSAVSAVVVTRWFLGNDPLFQIPAFELTHNSELLVYACIGVAGGLVGVLFLKAAGAIREWIVRMPRWSVYVRPGVAGLLVGVAGIWFPEVMGAGYDAIDSALHGQFNFGTLLILGIVKVAVTLLCFSAGIPGGMFAPMLFSGAMIGGGIGAFAIMHWPFPVSSTSAYVLVGMGTFFAGVFRAPMTSIFMVFELSASYMIILPVMIANTIAYLVSRSLHKTAFFEMMARHEGLDLPSIEERRERRTLLVEDALQRAPQPAMPEARMMDPGTPVFAAIEQLRGRDLNSCLIPRGDGIWSSVSLEHLREAESAGKGRETVGHVVPFTVVPRLYPDFSLDTALRYFSSFPLLPVARRSNPGLLIGTLTLEDVHRAYGITEKGGTGAKLPVS